MTVSVLRVNMKVVLDLAKAADFFIFLFFFFPGSSEKGR